MMRRRKESKAETLATRPARKRLATRVVERLPHVNRDEERVLMAMMLLLGVVILATYRGVVPLGGVGVLVLLAGAGLTLFSLGVELGARRDLAGAFLLLGGGLAAFNITEFDIQGLLTIAGLVAAPIMLLQTAHSLALRKQFAPRALRPALRALRRALDRRLAIVALDLGVPAVIFPTSLLIFSDAISVAGTLLLF
ncbi:MAG TPA: hypothetical protein VI893_06365, partial [Thermoplasmata archaeon]|nr:hypothetical protein [Thermoplasmata archaeon]